MLENAGKKFDFVFMDPPYNMELEKRVMEAFTKSDMADEETVFIIEASLETSFSWSSEWDMKSFAQKNIKPINMYF